MTDITGFNCIDCKKIFSTKGSLTRHLNRCKGELLPNQCLYCKKMFSNSSNKTRHVKICKHKPIEEIKEGDININNSTINSNNINNTTNIQNTFNDNRQTHLYLTNDQYMDFIGKILSEGVTGFISTALKKLHFNDEYPEYKNIKTITKNFIEIVSNEVFKIIHKTLFFFQYIDSFKDIVFQYIDNLSKNDNKRLKYHDTFGKVFNWPDLGHDDGPDDPKYSCKQLEKIKNDISNQLYNNIKLLQ